MRLPSTEDLWLVDDDPAILELLADALQRQGRRVCTLASAGQAEQELLTSVPAVLVVDRMLGADDGMALIDRIHAAAWPAPAILISGNITPTLTAQAMRAGVGMVFEKPFAVEELIPEVDSAFERSAAAVEYLQRRNAAQQSLSALSDGHRAVLWELVACRPHKQIASRLDIALRTVEKRKKELFERLGVETFTELLTLLQAAGVEAPSAGDRQGFQPGRSDTVSQTDSFGRRIDSPHPLHIASLPYAGRPWTFAGLAATGSLMEVN
jgi:FixJ family two-component response regulator